jgi:hypothetical protein
VSSSLDHPLTRKSISIALAFALRACVRAKLRGRDASAVAGGRRVQFVRVVRSGMVQLVLRKTTPLFLPLVVLDNINSN